VFGKRTTGKAAAKGKAAPGPEKRKRETKPGRTHDQQPKESLTRSNREPETTRTGHLETGTTPGGENERGAADQPRELGGETPDTTRAWTPGKKAPGTERKNRTNQEGLQQQGSKSRTESDSEEARNTRRTNRAAKDRKGQGGRASKTPGARPTSPNNQTQKAETGHQGRSAGNGLPALTTAGQKKYKTKTKGARKNDHDKFEVEFLDRDLVQGWDQLG